MNNQAAQTMPEQWPEYVMLRDTKLHDDAGGLGQRIYTTAGAGYKKVKYVRADLAALSQAAGVARELTPLDIQTFARAYKAEVPGAVLTVHGIDAGLHALAAAPAASGGESHPDALPDGTLSKSTAKRVEALSSNPNPVTPSLSSESAASVSERARELLTAEYSKAHANGERDPDRDEIALRALEQALTQQRGSEPCLYVKPRLVEILHKLGPAQTEHRVMVSTVPDAQYTVCLSTTPQPGAEALRELIAEWKVRPGVTDAYKICADELESLLARGG